MPPHDGNIRRDDINGQTVNGQPISCPAIPRCEPPLQTYLLVLQHPNPSSHPPRGSNHHLPFMQPHGDSFLAIASELRCVPFHSSKYAVGGRTDVSTIHEWAARQSLLFPLDYPHMVFVVDTFAVPPFCRTHASIALPYSPF